MNKRIAAKELNRIATALILGKSIRIDRNTIQKLVIIMDMNGYEQDGKGPNFIGFGKNKKLNFDSWESVYDFVIKNFK